MTTTWILIANASRADLYAHQLPHHGLQHRQQFAHPASRDLDSELVSDRPGQYATDMGGHGSFSQPTDPKQHEEDKFAAELAHALENGRVSHKYERLILIASNPFMGKLNNHLPKHLQFLVTDRIEKDYTQATVQQLSVHLENILFV